MTNQEVQEMKSSWSETQIRIFFGEILGIYLNIFENLPTKLVENPSVRAIPLEYYGKIIYYGSLLFNDGLIHCLSSKNAQQRIYFSFMSIFDSLGVPKYVPLRTAFELLDKKIRKYEEDKLLVWNNPRMRENLDQRIERKIRRHSEYAFEVYIRDVNKKQNPTEETVKEIFEKVDSLKFSIIDNFVLDELAHLCGGNLNYLRKFISVLSSREDGTQILKTFAGGIALRIQKINSTLLVKVAKIFEENGL
jgi:hypothetical protein